MCGPNFGPMVYAFCLLQRARWAATGCIFHSCFLVLGARMLVSQYHGYVLQSACEGKKHAGPQPALNGSCLSFLQAKGTFQKGQGCQCCSAANMTATSNAKTCVPPDGSIQDPGRNPRHPQISKLTYFRTLQSYTRKGSKTSFCESQRWFLGSGAMFARAYPHTSCGSSVKLAIRIGSAAKLLSMCSKATKHGVAISYWLGRKATKNAFKSY